MPTANICFKVLISALFITLMSACLGSSSTPKEQHIHAIEGAYAADVSNDAKYSVVSSIHHGLSFWDLEKNALKYTWSLNQETADNLVFAVDISDDNSHVVTANKTEFALWNSKTGKSAGFWKVRESSIRDIAVSNNGNEILIGKSNNTVVHVNIHTGRRLEFLGHKEKINAVDMLPNGRIAMSGGNDFVAYVWDTKTGQVIYRFNHTSRVTMVALDPKGRYAFSADSKKEAFIWNLKTGKRISALSFSNRQEIFSSVQFSPKGDYMVTGAPSRKVSLWQVGTGQRTKSWRVTPRKDTRPAGAVVYAATFRDNNHIITESSAGFSELWQINE